MSSLSDTINIIFNANKPIILIDGSMFYFKLYLRIVQEEWLYKLTHQSKINYNELHNDADFLQHFTYNVKAFLENIIKSESLRYNIKNIEIDNIIFARDTPLQKNWRLSIYSDYKSGRPQMPEYNPFISIIFWDTILPELGVHIIQQDTLEADDLVYFSKKKLQLLYPLIQISIITEDKDYFQLADINTRIIDFGGKVIDNGSYNGAYDKAFKILIGDSSDNISNIFAGCGEVTARKILEKIDINLFFHKLKHYPLELVNDIIKLLPIKKQSTLKAADIKDKLLFNASLIDMNRIPSKFFEIFNNKYRFVDNRVNY